MTAFCRHCDKPESEHHEFEAVTVSDCYRCPLCDAGMKLVEPEPDDTSTVFECLNVDCVYSLAAAYSHLRGESASVALISAHEKITAALHGGEHNRECHGGTE